MVCLSLGYKLGAPDGVRDFSPLWSAGPLGPALGALLGLLLCGKLGGALGVVLSASRTEGCAVGVWEGASVGSIEGPALLGALLWLLLGSEVGPVLGAILGAPPTEGCAVGV